MFSLFFKRPKLDTASLEALEEALYQGDFGVETTEAVLTQVQTAYQKDKQLSGRDVAEIAAAVIKDLMQGAEATLKPGNVRPEVILLVGINGSGKTTTAARLGYYAKQHGYRCLLGACDTFRAAANEQIKLWAERLDLDLVASHQGADSAATAFDAYAAACHRHCDLAILDTAGRLHTQAHLIAELQKMVRVLKKREAAAPHHIWLVVDVGLGSNSIEQARLFHQEIGLTGLVATKLDGTSRGGALVGIYRALKLPIYFVGLGERAEDLKPFCIQDYLKGIFAD